MPTQVYDSGSDSNSVSNTTHSSTSRNIPGVPRNVFDAEQARTAEALKQLADALVGADTAQQKASQTAADATARAGELAGKATEAQGELAAAKADAAARARDVMGTDVSNPDADIVKFAAKRHETWRAMDALKNEIEAEDAIGVTEDPLRFLVNTIRVPLLKRTYNQLEAHAVELGKRVDAIEAETIAAQNLDTGSTRARESAAATAQAAAQVAAGLARSQELLAQGQHAHATLLMQQAALADKPMQMMTEAARLYSTSVTSGTSSTETHRTVDSVREAGAKAERERDLELINRKRRAAGQLDLSLNQFEGLAKPEQAKLVKNAQVLSSFDVDPYSSIMYLHDQGALNDNFRTANPVAADFLDRALRSKSVGAATLALQQDPASGFNKLHPVEQKARALDKAISTDYNTYMSGERRNYLAIPPESPLAFKLIFAAQQPELATNWVTKYVKGLVAADPRIITMPGGVRMEQVLDEATGRAVAASAAGDSLAVRKLAQELSDFTRQGQLLQYVRSGASLFGVPRPREYVAAGHRTEATGRALQLWTPIEVENYLMANAAKQRTAIQVQNPWAAPRVPN